MKYWQDILFGFKVLVIIGSYLTLALGYIPGFRVNRATIALITTGLLVSLGGLSLSEAWEAIDENTIIFLLSMMIINGNLNYSGFFNLCIWYLQRLILTPFRLIVLLTLTTGFLSALFLNDTLVSITTPLVLELTASLQINPIPYLLAIAGATNIGSLATINGNPQNILVGSLSGIGYLQFTKALIFPAIAGLLTQIGLLWWLYPEVRSGKILLTKREGKWKYGIYLPLLRKTLLITAATLAGFVVGLPMTEVAFLGATILLITRRLKPEKVFKQIDWPLLVMFSGLFILTHCVRSLNIFGFMEDWLNNNVNLVLATVGLSNLISNVPAVLLLQGIMGEKSSEKWLLLASSATLAGNFTLFGSVANLIMAESAKTRGYILSFWQHFRFGFPLTLVTTTITYFWIELLYGN